VSSDFRPNLSFFPSLLYFTLSFKNIFILEIKGSARKMQALLVLIMSIIPPTGIISCPYTNWSQKRD
jgi:hypothetical protein